jgi:tRNA dimethylallyltransferase
VGRPDVILVAGPTASGKSALALKLAERLGGVVINADSMQIYRDLRVLTARPTTEEEQRAPHALYGYVDAAENYSAGRWCVEAAAAMAATRSQGRLPILVGGTGLYFEALSKGLAPIPAVPDEVRAAVRQRLKAEGAASLHAELARRDPVMAQRLMPRDRNRIARALEVIIATGRSLADWHRDETPPALDFSRASKIFLRPDREELRRRIERRFAAMLREGALDEVRALAARRLDPALPAMKAHGVPWLIRHIEGELTLEAAAEAGVRDTWRYTKRQATWFRNRMPGWSWIEPELAEAAILHEIGRRDT